MIEFACEFGDPKRIEEIGGNFGARVGLVHETLEAHQKPDFIFSPMRGVVVVLPRGLVFAGDRLAFAFEALNASAIDTDDGHLRCRDIRRGGLSLDQRQLLIVLDLLVSLGDAFGPDAFGDSLDLFGTDVDVG